MLMGLGRKRTIIQRKFFRNWKRMQENHLQVNKDNDNFVFSNDFDL